MVGKSWAVGFRSMWERGRIADEELNSRVNIWPWRALGSHRGASPPEACRVLNRLSVRRLFADTEIPALWTWILFAFACFCSPVEWPLQTTHSSKPADCNPLLFVHRCVHRNDAHSGSQSSESLKASNLSFLERMEDLCVMCVKASWEKKTLRRIFLSIFDSIEQVTDLLNSGNLNGL